jgi:hypothetical protein
MNFSHQSDPWSRLASAARQVPDDRDVSAPYGFATRVAALAWDRRPGGSLFERFALRAVGVAGILAALSVIANFTFLSNNDTAEDELPADDPVSVLLAE